MTRLIVFIACLLISSSVVAGDPAIPRHHPLNQSQAGSLLLTELRCATCHTGVVANPLLEKTAPDLSEVGNRVSTDYLRRFLESPHTAQPGTSMPDMLASQSESEKSKIAEALTHFLVAQGGVPWDTEPIESFDRKQGKELFHSIGCVACHGPQEPFSGSSPAVRPGYEDDDDDDDISQTRAIAPVVMPDTISLEHVHEKYSLRSLADFLFHPLTVRSSGRMPDMKLTPAESLAIAGYLIGDASPTKAKLKPDDVLVESGKKYFQTLNCASCHPLKGMDAALQKSSLKTANLEQGCLSKEEHPKEKGNGPRFTLSTEQESAIVAALREEPSKDSDQVVMAKTLTAFRCINCHVRDDYGGVHDAHNFFFKGSELNLGDDGRIPPPLTLMGAKLQPNWLKKVLFDGESVRYYMATRMPQYGADNLQHLPELFSRLDQLDGPEMKIPSPESRDESEREREKTLRPAGRELLGDKGANCVACHQFNGKAANVNQGIDLLTSYERLQPAWFYHYLLNPGGFRPRTVMPTAWPDGKSNFKTILEGDTDQQIEAIWYYLSLGTSAADPSGVRTVNTKLEVADKAIVYRGRSRVAGYRGIAVGLPGGVNYAFNAETGTLSAVWMGDFVNVNWSGQGAGDFNPAREPIVLAQDVSFTALPNENAPWPLLPVMTKEAPVNPDPLYPKNLGYQFQGYFLDEQSIPTLMYRIGTIAIQDRSIVINDESQRRLQRVLQMEAPSPQAIWYRALTGDIVQESDSVYRSGRLRLSIPSTEVRLRALPDEQQGVELLLRLQIPQGESTMELQYDVLNK
ncbi:hypothetical protein SH449x_003868 [Pirellulaceae bacterium SH449]